MFFRTIYQMINRPWAPSLSQVAVELLEEGLSPKLAVSLLFQGQTVVEMSTAIIELALLVAEPPQLLKCVPREEVQIGKNCLQLPRAKLSASTSNPYSRVMLKMLQKTPWIGAVTHGLGNKLAAARRSDSQSCLDEYRPKSKALPMLDKKFFGFGRRDLDEHFSSTELMPFPLPVPGSTILIEGDSERNPEHPSAKGSKSGRRCATNNEETHPSRPFESAQSRLSGLLV